MKKNLTEISKELNRISRFKGMPRLIFMTDNVVRPHPEEVIDQMPKGSMVILRDYDDENRYDLAQALSYICKSKEIKFLVAGDLTLALMVDADGVHLPEFMMDEVINIQRDHSDLIITVAAHSSKALEKADQYNVYAALLAPIFPTKSHPETLNDPEKVIGVDQLAECCIHHKTPLYALGGINQETAKMIMHTGLAGFAVIRGI